MNWFWMASVGVVVFLKREEGHLRGNRSLALSWYDGLNGRALKIAVRTFLRIVVLISWSKRAFQRHFNIPVGENVPGGNAIRRWSRALENTRSTATSWWKVQNKNNAPVNVNVPPPLSIMSMLEVFLTWAGKIERCK